MHLRNRPIDYAAHEQWCNELAAALRDIPHMSYTYPSDYMKWYIIKRIEIICRMCENESFLRAPELHDKKMRS